MIKRSLKTPFIQIEYQEYPELNEILADFIIESMSEDNELPFIDLNADPNVEVVDVDVGVVPDDLDVVLRDLSDINQMTTIEYIQSDEERQQIYQLEQELKSPSATSSNQSFDQYIQSVDLHNSLFNPIDMNLIRPESETVGNELPFISSIETTQSVPIRSPLSPDTQMSKKMDTLSIVDMNVGNNSSQSHLLCNTNQIMDPSFESDSMLSSQTESSTKRNRCLTFSGPYNVYDMSQTNATFVEPFIGVQTPININIQSNRVSHTVQPYSRSSTDPLPVRLPPFSPTFDFQFQRPPVTMNLVNPMSGSFTSSGTNIMSQSVQNPSPHYSSFNQRSVSEPEIPQTSYRFIRTQNNRGRPPSRQNPRRQTTARERRDALEKEETEQSLNNYYLNTECLNISNEIQYIKRKLLRMGLTPQQLDDWQRLSQN